MPKANKSALALQLGVSRSSLYYKSKLDLKDQLIREQILAVQDEHPAYGHKRIAIALGYNKKRILRIMKKYHIVCRRSRAKRPVKLADLGNEPRKYLNWAGLVCPLKPGIFWASDFTYLWFEGRFYYLATIIDVVSREILGIAFSPFHNKELVMEALVDALSRNTVPKYLHSDQGSEYNSEAYIDFAQYKGITISMAPKGSPWWNGYQESFYSQFKLELGTLARFQTLGELVEAIYLQIHYYNHRRIHSALKMPPATYAKQYLVY
ncbi:hypothetical protein COV81_03485 [Candidatus Peregrinibacteria bacterium CG11_big_fil_rev_8_21_14_0_20_41_10]|nr:MAG: hypothetical protein COV81_03485 [Candidatus Peregrinibacteria bacterium CG11_big_fil_rev_8_21_14_0_20_41_10]PIZ76243.1 MAG: hypothetical protein COY06_02140 [Candidatus Peregrinibacteria bacterium CG_4_10_14_0_2_um_filter_41_8]